MGSQTTSASFQPTQNVELLRAASNYLVGAALSERDVIDIAFHPVVIEDIQSDLAHRTDANRFSCEESGSG